MSVSVVIPKYGENFVWLIENVIQKSSILLFLYMFMRDVLTVEEDEES